MKKIIKFIWSLRPSMAKETFRNVRNFVHCDGFKLAILYGKFYYLKNRYVNGQLDTEYRKKMLNEIIDRFRFPVSHSEQLAMLIELRNGVVQADADGLIAVKGNSVLNKEEADKHQKALDSLNYLINAVKYHPIIWKRVFLARS